MPKWTKKNIGQFRCAYCLNKAENQDHIPPKCFFLPSTQNRTWVPSCLACNKHYSKDDEFCWIFLCKAAGDLNPVSEDLNKGKINRALTRSVGIGRKVANQTVSFDIITKSGIITGDQVKAIEITDKDWTRIQSFLIRLIKGFVYHASDGNITYDDHVYYVIDLESPDGIKILNTESQLKDLINENEVHSIVDARVLKFKVIPIEGSKKEHIWIMNFYDRKKFLVQAISNKRV